MTKSTITREQLLEIIETDHVQCGEASYLARMALAAMDSEPVAWLLSGGGTKNIVVFDSGNAYADPLREVTPLYRHAQPAPASMEDHQIRELVNELRDISIECHGTQQLRERIARTVRAAMLNGGKS
ncbi:TPA: hypothetical protein ACJ2OZ_001008 [Klebsiella pneumoniae]